MIPRQRISQVPTLSQRLSKMLTQCPLPICHPDRSQGLTSKPQTPWPTWPSKWNKMTLLGNLPSIVKNLSIRPHSKIQRRPLSSPATMKKSHLLMRRKRWREICNTLPKRSRLPFPKSLMSLSRKRSRRSLRRLPSITNRWSSTGKSLLRASWRWPTTNQILVASQSPALIMFMGTLSCQWQTSLKWRIQPWRSLHLKCPRGDSI
jgi:hypothetical protein